MRQSIGTTFMLNFIILFIFLVFAFLAGTLSYYKAYKINNNIVHAIERYGGYNDYSIAEINDRLAGLDYEVDIVNSCPETWKNSTTYAGNIFLPPGELTEVDEGKGSNGYCIYVYRNDNNFEASGYFGTVETTDNYNTYGVLTYLQFQFPGLQYLLKIPIFSKTNRMYDFS